MVWCCVPSPGCLLVGVLSLHPFDSIRRELVPWCHCAMEFHLCRLFSALVPMPGLLCCRIFRGFPSVPPAMRVVSSSASIPHIPPSLQVLCFGVEVSASGMEQQGDVQSGVRITLSTWACLLLLPAQRNYKIKGKFLQLICWGQPSKPEA